MSVVEGRVLELVGRSRLFEEILGSLNFFQSLKIILHVQFYNQSVVRKMPRNEEADTMVGTYYEYFFETIGGIS